MLKKHIDKTFISCSCGTKIDYSVVYLNNYCNDLGEDFYEIYYTCNNCDLEYNYNGWGHLEYSEAKQEMIIHITKHNAL